MLISLFSGSVVLDEKILNINTKIIGLTYCSPTRLLGPWFEETWICTISGSFHVNLSFSGLVVL
jgi:hypothetical protein